MIYSVGNLKPEFSGKYFVAESATVVGNVKLGHQASVWFGAVVRGDVDSITIGDETNIQDCSVLHVDHEIPLVIGRGVTVGHSCVLHGCTVGNDTLIGIKSVVMSGAKIGNNCLIGANTLITEGKVIPDGSLVVGSPGRVIRELTLEEIEAIRENARHYVENAELYEKELKPI
ncbi:MAG: gamma carbonic anhydrase family protein [Burkholderiales bacterium]|nr:gamma carbonic anhydrase family protein [Burkholderiales bacterium]